MDDLFSVSLDKASVDQISNLGLAHVGDGVYELLVRTKLCIDGKYKSNRALHHAAVNFVSAPAQAQAVKRIEGEFTPDEVSVFRRGRNAKVNTVPKNANIMDYHMATGLETLFGYLYLTGQHKRINELFSIAIDF